MRARRLSERRRRCAVDECGHVTSQRAEMTIALDESLTSKAQIRSRICYQPTSGDLLTALRAFPISSIQQPILCVINFAQTCFQLRAMKPLNVPGVFVSKLFRCANNCRHVVTGKKTRATSQTRAQSAGHSNQVLRYSVCACRPIRGTC